MGVCPLILFIERFWRSVKYEEIYTKEYDSIDELTRSLRIYFEFYNNERTHAGLGGKHQQRSAGALSL
ncbi:MAG: transposase [Desulfobulbaceae bacterium]|nr:transposase [Desulfobulbaceae bacterium]